MNKEDIKIVCDRLRELADQDKLEGIVDIPIEVYHHSDCPGLSKTDCTILLEKTFFEYERLKNLKKRYSEATEKEILADDDLMQVRRDMDRFKHGRAVHTYVLEPHKFESEFCTELDRSTMPKPLSRKKADMEIYEAEREAWIELNEKPWIEQSAGKTVLTLREMRRVKQVGDMVKSNETFKKISEGALIEHTIFFKMHGVLFKTRPDILNVELSLCPDLKTTQDATVNEFQRSITKYYYDLQGAIQVEGAKKIFGKDFMMGFFAAETYDCRPFRLDDASLDTGRELMKVSAKRYLEGLEKKSKGIHTGYSQDFESIGNAPWGFNIDSRI